MNEIHATMTKVNIGEDFKRSSHTLAKLHLTQKQMNLPKLILKQDVVTRWNSTYNMLARMVQVKYTVMSMLTILQNNLDILLTLHDWIIIEKCIDVLKMCWKVFRTPCVYEYRK